MIIGQAEVSFKSKKGILYRVYKAPLRYGGRPLKQVMVPQSLRQHIMGVAHGSTMGGHMGIKKTTTKIESAFCWPGINAGRRGTLL